MTIEQALQECNLHPASKEQCGLLFAKMREKGYEWNSKKKEVIRNR